MTACLSTSVTIYNQCVRSSPSVRVLSDNPRVFGLRNPSVFLYGVRLTGPSQLKVISIAPLLHLWKLGRRRAKLLLNCGAHLSGNAAVESSCGSSREKLQICVFRVFGSPFLLIPHGSRVLVDIAHHVTTEYVVPPRMQKLYTTSP